jgi:hypothetical protein
MEVLVHLKKFNKLYNRKPDGIDIQTSNSIFCFFFCRNFTLQTLGRIKTIHPTMYRFQQEKIQLPTLSPVKLNYELTISPGTSMKKKSFQLYYLFFLSADFGIQSDMQITALIIVERIDCFRRALLNLVKAHHRVKKENLIIHFNISFF